MDAHITDRLFIAAILEYVSFFRVFRMRYQSPSTVFEVSSSFSMDSMMRRRVFGSGSVGFERKASIIFFPIPMDAKITDRLFITILEYISSALGVSYSFLDGWIL